MRNLANNVMGIVLVLFTEMIVVSPLGAEPQLSDIPTTQEPRLSGIPTTQEPLPEEKPEIIPTKPTLPIPFARQERALRSSERWKTMTPEEQTQALEKIQHYRKLFQERQLQLWKKYKPYLEEKPKKRESFLSRRRSKTTQFESLWAKWLRLPHERKKALERRWGVNDTIPSRERNELLRIWNKLSTTKRRRLLQDVR